MQRLTMWVQLGQNPMVSIFASYTILNKYQLTAFMVWSHLGESFTSSQNFSCGT